MLAYYKEMKKTILISFLIVLLDGIIVYYVPSYFNHINYLYPMLTISFIPFLIKKKSKVNIIYIAIIGIMYDLLYSNILLYNTILFILLASFNKIIVNYFKDSILLYIILGITNIVIYDTFSFILVLITSYQSVTIGDLLYKIRNSILLNIMSIFICYFLCKNKNN